MFINLLSKGAKPCWCPTFEEVADPSKLVNSTPVHTECENHIYTTERDAKGETGLADLTVLFLDITACGFPSFFGRPYVDAPPFGGGLCKRQSARLPAQGRSLAQGPPLY